MFQHPEPQLSPLLGLLRAFYAVDFHAPQVLLLESMVVTILDSPSETPGVSCHTKQLGARSFNTLQPLELLQDEAVSVKKASHSPLSLAEPLANVST